MRQSFLSLKHLLIYALAAACVATLALSPIVVKAGQTSSGIVRGQALFEGKGGCFSCHRVADQGSYMGPDLSAIGSTLSLEELNNAIISPNAAVSSQNRLYQVVDGNGKTITGRLFNQDIYLVQMLTTDANLVTLKKSTLRSFDFIDTPPMPSYSSKLSVAEQTDLVAYLASLRGVVNQ
jgi:putative heme-binding domain-containing protein